MRVYLLSLLFCIGMFPYTAVSQESESPAQPEETRFQKFKAGLKRTGTKIKEGFQKAGKNIKEGLNKAGKKIKAGVQSIKDKLKRKETMSKLSKPEETMSKMNDSLSKPEETMSKMNDSLSKPEETMSKMNVFLKKSVSPVIRSASAYSSIFARMNDDLKKLNGITPKTDDIDFLNSLCTIVDTPGLFDASLYEIPDRNKDNVRFNLFKQSARLFEKATFKDYLLSTLEMVRSIDAQERDMMNIFSDISSPFTEQNLSQIVKKIVTNASQFNDIKMAIQSRTYGFTKIDENLKSAKKELKTIKIKGSESALSFYKKAKECMKKIVEYLERIRTKLKDEHTQLKAVLKKEFPQWVSSW